MSGKWPKPGLCGILFDDDGRVLLAQTASAWRLPGGPLRGGRDWLTGLAEEIQADTGIAIVDRKLIGMYSGDPEARVVASFLITDFDGDPRPGEAVDELGWFLPDELPDSLQPPDRQRIEDALRFQGRPIVR